MRKIFGAGLRVRAGETRPWKPNPNGMGKTKWSLTATTESSGGKKLGEGYCKSEPVSFERRDVIWNPLGFFPFPLHPLTNETIEDDKFRRHEAASWKR